MTRVSTHAKEVTFPLRVALVHDWLITWRGGEKVLEALVGLFPDAEIFTLFHEPGAMAPAIEARPIHTAFLDRLPGARRRHRQAFPLMPWAIERLDLAAFDLVISSSHCVAKGVRVPAGARHLSYVHEERVPKHGYRDILVEFRAKGEDSDGDSLKYTWDFGDHHKL